MNIQLLQDPLSFRDRDNQPELLVLHATAGATARSSIDHLRGVGLSYHYIITRDAKDSSKTANAENTEPVIFHCVPNIGHAFHVGSTIPAPGAADGRFFSLTLFIPMAPPGKCCRLLLYLSSSNGL